MIRSARLPTGQNPTIAAVGPFTDGVIRGLHIYSSSSPSGDVTLAIFTSKKAAQTGVGGRTLGTFTFPVSSPSFFINIDERVKAGECLGFSMPANVAGTVDLWVWFRVLP